MSAQALLIEVRWPDGRFHGVRDVRAGEGARGAPVAPEWPPSPFRLFQALVAGAYGGRWAAEARADKDAAFEWLEELPPPDVYAPAVEALRPVTYFVPNNDLDSVRGDPARVGEIRAGKALRTSLFDRDRPAAYLWRFAGDPGPAERLAELAGRLHTLGHGIDAAFASAEVLDAGEAELRLQALGGAPRRPSLTSAGGGAGAPCPTRGSLRSLRLRHAAFTGRLDRSGTAKRPVVRFSQPPKAHARAVVYERAATRRLYELRPAEGSDAFLAWPLTQAAGLVLAARGLIETGLKGTWPTEVERLVVGRGAGPGDAALRLRLLPLPSIGMRHTDMSIRRLALDIPPDHPIPVNDLDWALAGRELAHPLGGKLLLVPASDRTMLERYLPEARVWRTVTPAALPAPVGRVRTGEERAVQEAQAAGAVAAALRHAGVSAAVETVRVQREPFDGRGERAERFCADRFAARDLRHVEVSFAASVAGPLVLGDGRWLGLGVMRPVEEPQRLRATGGEGLHLFQLDGPPVPPGAVETLTRALRRAVMARAQEAVLERGRREALPVFFHGHEEDGGPARDGSHAHLFFAFDPGGENRPPRLAVIAPHRADHTRGLRTRTRHERRRLDQALRHLTLLRAGEAGRFALTRADPLPDDPLFGLATTWTSWTPYRPTRAPKRGEDVAKHLVADVIMEAARRAMPRLLPEGVTVIETVAGPRGGVSARLRLRFETAVRGPILLGAGSHFGAGLFARDPGDGAA